MNLEPESPDKIGSLASEPLIATTPSERYYVGFDP